MSTELQNEIEKFIAEYPELPGPIMNKALVLLGKAMNEIESIRNKTIEECAGIAERTASDHNDDTPGGFCAKNAALHAANCIRSLRRSGT